MITAADIINWELIEVPRANLYKWHVSNDHFGNEVQYEEIYNWCRQMFHEDDWVSMIKYDGVKQFYFKDPKCATLFRLRWNY